MEKSIKQVFEQTISDQTNSQEIPDTTKWNPQLPCPSSLQRLQQHPSQTAKMSVPVPRRVRCHVTGWERMVSSLATMAKMYIATVALEQHVIPSIAAYTATIRSFLPEPPLIMEMQWERVLPMERCRATDMAPTDLLPALTASTFIEIVRQEPLARLRTEFFSAVTHRVWRDAVLFQWNRNERDLDCCC